MLFSRIFLQKFNFKKRFQNSIFCKIEQNILKMSTFWRFQTNFGVFKLDLTQFSGQDEKDQKVKDSTSEPHLILGAAV